MNVNVHGGTAKHGENLCSSCAYAHRTELQNGKAVTVCHASEWTPHAIPSPVVRCNKYLHTNAVTLHEMKSIAWVIVPGKEHLGFRKRSKLSEEEREKIDD
jgi:hypothetical protein